MFRMFRVFRLLPKLSQESKVFHDTWQTQDVLRCSGFCTTLAKMNFLGGPPNMFRVFRLLPKLSNELKN
jgi:hypothetical protein